MHPFAKALVPTVLCCAGLALLTGTRSAGFMVYLAVPFLLIWLLYSLWIAWRQPMQRPITVVKIVLWVLTLSGIGALHSFYATAARQEADAVVAGVMDYQRKFGTYPKPTEITGLPVRGKWRVFYSLVDGRPHVFYPATFMVFTVYNYDFDHQAWEYCAD